MASGVITVGRRRYAVGLYWENSPGGRTAQAAKEAAKQPGQTFEFYAIRPGYKSERLPQFGLGLISAGHKAGMAAFAGCLANQLGGSWAGGFQMRDGIAVIVVRDDLILPDGDLFFEDENEARERLMQEMAFGGLQRIYAPDNWSIPTADNMPLSLLLNERRDIRLNNVTVPRKQKILFGVAGALLIVALGIGWYIEKKQAEEEALRLAQQEAMRRSQQNANNLLPKMLQQHAMPEVKYDRAWESAPPLLDVINACLSMLPTIDASPYGWHVTQLKCDNSGISLTWNRERGVSAPLPDAAKILENGNAASMKVNYPKALTARGHEDLLDPETITSRYITEGWPGTISRAPEDKLPPAPKDYQGAWTPSPAPWVKRSFTLTMQELPSVLPSIFQGMPGAVVTTINASFPGLTPVWTVEGVIYENRK